MKNDYKEVSSKGLIQKFKPKIVDLNYLAQSPEETVCARATAVSLLTDPEHQSAAADFLKRSSVGVLDKEVEIKRLRELAVKITMVKSLEILSRYSLKGTQYCEYRFTYYDQDKREHVIHQHAEFQQAEKGWQFASQRSQTVRVVGDPILHQKGKDFPLEAKPGSKEMQELKQQYEQAKVILIETGGGGIAANQCMIPNPYNFTIVGVYNDNREHVSRVEQRYPGVKFPNATLMINPEIKKTSEDKEKFWHGCLSMPNSLRGNIESPKEITVAYWTLDAEDNLVQREETYRSTENIAPIVLYHELSHISFGKMFFDHSLEALKKPILENLLVQLNKELESRNKQEWYELADTPAQCRVFPGDGTFNSDELTYSLKYTTDYVLDGMKNRVKFQLQNKNTAKTDFHNRDGGSGKKAEEDIEEKSSVKIQL